MIWSGSGQVSMARGIILSFHKCRSIGSIASRNLDARTRNDL